MASFVITAGHSNTDPGAVAKGRTEAAIVADLRNIVALKLRERGHIVTTDGAGTVNQPLPTAISLIRPGLVCVELHCNAAANSTAAGVETISMPRHKALSQRLSQAIAKVLETRVRGDKGWIDQSQSARGKLGFVSAGGLIVELFFISNPAELRMYDARKWLVATAIADTLEAA